jgi:hypothetical protein
MLPWASFPKRFSTGTRKAPRNGALGRAWGQVQSRICAQGADAIERSARKCLPSLSRFLVLQSPLVSTIVPQLRCDVPLRVASRCTVSGALERNQSRRPFSKCPQVAVPGAKKHHRAVFLADYDHLAKCGRVQSTDLGRRSAWDPDIPLVRDAVGCRDSIGDTTPRTRILLDNARENTVITVQNASGPAFSASVPAVGSRCSRREHTWIHTAPQTHSKE